tara:strand:- start:180 stop:1130 length:951 start_codon:yes stop_codon:yes gene_type:complete
LFHTTQNAQLAERMGFGRSPEIKQVVLSDRISFTKQIHYIKFRPGLHEYLARCAMSYKLYINTHATTEYAHAIIQLIDPHGTYFGGRIVSRTTDTPTMKALNQHLDFNLDHLNVSNSIIIDDRLDVWNENELESIVRIEPYNYFRPLTHQTSDFDDFDDELSSVDMDDQLMHVGDLLMKVEVVYREFMNLKKTKIDVRQFLRHFRKGILTNVSICFDNGMTFQTLQMKQYVQFFGANVTNDVLRGATTHLITTTGLSEKAQTASRINVKVVSFQWLTMSMALFKHALERDFPVLLMQKEDDVAMPEIEPNDTRYKD